MEVSACITLPDGRVVKLNLEDNGKMPSPDEFDMTDEHKFLNTYDKYERSIIDMRDRLTKSITEAVVEELKKTESPEM